MPTELSLDQHVAAIKTAGDVLVRAAREAGLDAPVPTCPEWDVRELVTHQGMIHRWAAANLRGEADHRMSESTAAAAAAPDLLDWLAEATDALSTPSPPPSADGRQRLTSPFRLTSPRMGSTNCCAGSSPGAGASCARPSRTP